MFTRQIEGKHGQQIHQENVPWSVLPRYVSRLTNLGNAQVVVVNLEAELAWRDVSKDAPNVTFRGSAGLASSRISTLPGPDNHLDKLTPWTMKLGGSFAMTTAPLRFDLDANWRPGQWTRTSMTERVYAPRSFECDASTIWTIDQDTRLVLGVVFRHPRGKELIHEYAENAQATRLYTSAQTSSKLKLQFETKL
jgi:hypothetical protein